MLKQALEASMSAQPLSAQPFAAAGGGAAAGAVRREPLRPFAQQLAKITS